MVKINKKRKRGGEVAGRGQVLLSMACQIDHFGSLEEDVSAY